MDLKRDESQSYEMERVVHDDSWSRTI